MLTRHACIYNTIKWFDYFSSSKTPRQKEILVLITEIILRIKKKGIGENFYTVMLCTNAFK